MAGKQEPDARLDLLSGRDSGKEFKLFRDKRAAIGTARKATIRLRDPGLQYRHAAIYFAEDCFWLITERPGCEATARGAPLTPQVPIPLCSGDLVTLGPVQARFIRLDKGEKLPDEKPSDTPGSAEPTSGSADCAAPRPTP